MKKIVLLTFFLSCAGVLSAQSNKSEIPHEHHKGEFGLSNALVYFTQDKTFSYGMHLHYVRNIAETPFGLGLGYERIFDIHGHNTFGVETIFRPTEALSLSLSPGLTFEDKDPNPGFAVHFETSYEFELKKLHIGPSLEFARDPEDFHISLGLHMGFGF